MQNVANKQMKVAIIVLNILLYLQYHSTLIVDCIYDAFTQSTSLILIYIGSR